MIQEGVDWNGSVLGLYSTCWWSTYSQYFALNCAEEAESYYEEFDYDEGYLNCALQIKILMNYIYCSEKMIDYQTNSMLYLTLLNFIFVHVFYRLESDCHFRCSKPRSRRTIYPFLHCIQRCVSGHQSMDNRWVVESKQKM